MVPQQFLTKSNNLLLSSKRYSWSSIHLSSSYYSIWITWHVWFSWIKLTWNISCVLTLLRVGHLIISWRLRSIGSWWLRLLLRNIDWSILLWSKLRFLNRNDLFLLKNIDFLRSNIIWLTSLILILRRSNNSSFWRSHRNHILQHIRMPSLRKIISKYTISLILSRITFEPIKWPISPINISLFEISHEMFPRNISVIVAKLTKEVRMTKSSDKCLSIC